MEVIKEGVVAEYNGKYWGVQYEDGQSTSYGFGDISNASIGNPKYCLKPTDMTYDPANAGGYNPYYNELKKATLVKVRKTIKFELLP